MTDRSDKVEPNSVLQKTRKLLAGSKTFENALPQLLQLFAEDLGCQWAVCWTVDVSVGVLRFTDVWQSPEIHAEALEEDTRKRTFSSGEGMTGRVWRSRQPAWSADVIRDMMIPRSLKAQGAGFESGMWFPILTDTTTYGVIEILRRKSVSPDEEILRLLETLGKELGRYIEHTRAQP